MRSSKATFAQTIPQIQKWYEPILLAVKEGSDVFLLPPYFVTAHVKEKKKKTLSDKDILNCAEWACNYWTCNKQQDVSLVLIIRVHL